MNRALKLSLIGAGVVGGGLLIYALIRRWNNQRAIRNQNNNSSNGGSTNNTPATPKGDDKLPLKKGSYGEKVKVLQDSLVKKYNQNLGTSGPNKDGVDGDFGPITETAVKNVQARDDYASAHDALASFKPTLGEVDAVTYLLIVGKAY